MKMQTKKYKVFWLLLISSFVMTAAPPPLSAQLRDRSLGPASEEKPEELKGLEVSPAVQGHFLDLSLPFTNEEGKTVPLSHYFQNKKQSLLVSLVYFSCPSLCNLHLNALAETLQKVKLKAGRDFRWLVISFDDREGHELAVQKKKIYTDKYGDLGWEFLTAASTPQDEPNRLNQPNRKSGDKMKSGSSDPHNGSNDPHKMKMNKANVQRKRSVQSKNKSIEKLTQQLGFRFRWSEKMQEWAHSSGVFVLSPKGQISHYLQGLYFTERTLRLALVEAAGGNMGSWIDKFSLLCFRYNPYKNKYTLYAESLMRAGGAFMVLLLLIYFIFLLRDIKGFKKSYNSGEGASSSEKADL